MSGWKLTPREATREMDVVGMEAVGFGDDTEAAWRAMSEAAPSPPEDVLERMARAFLEEYDTYRPGRSEAGRQREATRAALAAAEKPTQPNPQGEDHAR